MQRRAGFFKKKYGLAMAMAPADRKELLAEVREIKQAILQWHDRRTTLCEQVMLTVVCPVELHVASKELLNKLFRGDDSVASMLGKIQVTIRIMDTDRVLKEELEFIP